MNLSPSQQQCLKEVFHDEFLQDGWANANAGLTVYTFAESIIKKLIYNYIGKDAKAFVDGLLGTNGLVTEMVLFFHKVHEAKHGGDPVTSADLATVGHAAIGFMLSFAKLAGKKMSFASIISFATSIVETLEPFVPCIDPPKKEYPDTDPATKVKSPLAIDLDGDGIATYAMKKGVFFDIDKDGFAEKMGWLTEKDAFLAIDRNKNGIIDDASELFGDSDKAANGFEALKAMDSNGDGVIDANDAGWEDLMLWQDVINDGISQDKELVSVAEAGIERIELNYTNQNVTDENGNQHLQTATVYWKDGHTTVIEDIWFSHDNAKTIDLTPLDVTDEEWAELAELPYIDAFGNVHSLWVAMSLDARNDEFFTKSSDFQVA